MMQQKFVEAAAIKMPATGAHIEEEIVVAELLAAPGRTAAETDQVLFTQKFVPQLQPLQQDAGIGEQGFAHAQTISIFQRD